MAIAFRLHSLSEEKIEHETLNNSIIYMSFYKIYYLFIDEENR